MKLLMLRCELGSYVKILHAVQHVGGGREHINVRREYSYGASNRVKTHKFVCTLMRDADKPHFIEIST